MPINLTPQAKARLIIEMADEYEKIGEALAEIDKRKAFKIVSLRAENVCKSYADAERTFDITDDGQKSISYKAKLKALEKLMSAYKSELRVDEMAARNQS